MHLLQARLAAAAVWWMDNLIKKLEHVQNTAAKLVFNLRKYDCITPALVTLHWLQVKITDWIQNAIERLQKTSWQGTYLYPINYQSIKKQKIFHKIPKYKHDTFGEGAFAVCGPLALGCLPKEIRLCDETEAFKRNLKTHLFVCLALYKHCKPSIT